MKLWINEHDFIEIDDRKSLSTEIAPRSRSLDWMGIMGFLPDPDPVLRKLGQDITVYRQLLSDAHVWSCYQSRKSGSLSCEWEIKDAASGGRKSDKGAYNLIVDMMEDLDVYQIITDMLDAPFYGMSPVEVIWQSIAGKWLPDRVVGKPPEWFQFDPENNLRFKSVDDMIEGEEIPEYKFLLPRHHASYQNPYGERVLSRCFWPVVFKRGGFKYWAVFTEKFGMPWVRGKVPRGTNDTERARLLDNLSKMVADAVAVINDDESVEITEAAGKSASADIYERLVSASNREVSKAILGQTLTTELDKGGSFAATKEHMEVRGDLVDQDKRMVAGAFNLLFTWIVELNFAGATPPKFSFYQEEDIQKERSERDTELSNQGVRFTPKYYQRTFNLAEDDFEIVEPPGSQGALESGGSFQEDVKKNSELSRALKAQGQIDDLVIEKINEAAAFFDNYKAQIADFLENAGSLEDAKRNILNLYDELDAKPLAQSLADALMTADNIGVKSIGGGAGFAEWGPATPFSEAVDFFRAKAFTIAGVTKADLLSGVKDELIKSMETGSTLEEFKKSFDSLFDKHGYDRLSPYRIDNIFRTNMQTAYQAGRYRQMTSPAVVKTKPYWRYVAVMDISTRPEHAAMNGKIYRYDHPFWLTWYPPNGFKCRCTVVSVSAREIERNGWKIETKDITGGLIEPTDPVTGKKMPGRPLMPDEGWGGRPHSLEKIFADKAAKKRLGAIAWKEINGQLKPKDMGRLAEKNIDERFWNPSPGKTDGLINLTGTIGKTAAFEKIETDFKRIMGISPNESFGVLKGPDSEIIKVDLNSLAHAMLDRKGGRERYLSYFRQVIEDPYEILLTEYETAKLKNTKVRKKYIGLFRETKKEGVVVVGEISPEGWAMWNVMNAKKGTIDRQRRGVKMLWGK